jgi:hypothetical protein
MRVDDNPELAGEGAEPVRVVAVPWGARCRHDHTVVVQVFAGRDAGVRRADERVRVFDRRRAVLGLRGFKTPVPVSLGR